MPGLAARLATSFGKVQAMRELYHDNVIWTLFPSVSALGLPVATRYEGKEAVMAFN
jgi:hypothetical protein